MDESYADLSHAVITFMEASIGGNIPFDCMRASSSAFLACASPFLNAPQAFMHAIGALSPPLSHALLHAVWQSGAREDRGIAVLGMCN